MNAKRVFGEARAPDESGAQARAWTVVRSAYLERQPSAERRRRRLGPALVLALAILAGAVALSPAGATVGRLITRALGVQHAARTLFSLPAPGRLLVSGRGGTWTIAADGSTRRLGRWREASWSPHGLFIAVADGDRLMAVDPRGTPRWALARRRVSGPQWYSPTGVRVAYRSGSDLRVVAGDGTGDRLLAAGVAPVAPAWRPGHPYELAYMTSDGVLVIRDADTGFTSSTARPATRVRKLVWSADGSRLLVLGRRGAWVYERGSRPAFAIVARPRRPILDGSLSPDGENVALARGGAGDVAIARLRSPRPRAERVLPGAGLGGLVWSPDSHWLLVSWPAADQWVFVRVTGRPRIEAFSRITEQFGSRGAFPRLEGWCCTVQGTTG